MGALIGVDDQQYWRGNQFLPAVNKLGGESLFNIPRIDPLVIHDLWLTDVHAHPFYLERTGVECSFQN